MLSGISSWYVAHSSTAKEVAVGCGSQHLPGLLLRQHESAGAPQHVTLTIRAAAFSCVWCVCDHGAWVAIMSGRLHGTQQEPAVTAEPISRRDDCGRLLGFGSCCRISERISKCRTLCCAVM